MKIIDDIKTALTGKEKDIPHNTDIEAKILSEIITNQQAAENKRTDIEVIWDDEYKTFKGDQWSLSFARRSKDSKAVRPNSVDNFVFPAIMNMHGTLTATTPEVSFEITDGDDSTDDAELEKIVTDVVADILDKNKFSAVWKKMVLRCLKHGPIIGYVPWDNDWIGGTGPNRWIGEVRIISQKMKEIYFDPAILDLEERLQECSFIHRKFRKKLTYFVKKWPDKGEMVNADNNETEDEGVGYSQAWLYEAWNKGKPKFIPDEYKKEFTQKSQDCLPPSVTVDYYKAEKYKLMAQGKIDGVHVSYASQNVFLEYIPYVYDDGMYPFVYKVLYEDEKCPYGFGEERNIMVPQVMHNKADEIEIEAMSVEGLGGYLYSKGAIDTKQLAFLQQNNARGGMFAEVNNVAQMKAREGVKVPQSIREYKEHKQRMVETISKNTAIQQGIAPSGNIAARAISELGARTDIGTKGRVEILEDFLKELMPMVVSRIKQFYTEERSYKKRDGNQEIQQQQQMQQLTQMGTMPDGPDKINAIMSHVNSMMQQPPKQKTGRFSNVKMTKTWIREEVKDEFGTPILNEDGTPFVKSESYMPEFSAKVKIIDDKPTDRNYYIQIADKLMQIGLLDPEDYLYVVEEGKLPPKELILQKYKQRQQQMMQQQSMAMAANTAQPPQGNQPLQQDNGHPADQLFAMLSPEQQQQMMQMSPDQQKNVMAAMIQAMQGGQ